MNIVTVDQVLKTIIAVAAVFATLPGITLLVSALTNAIKWIASFFGWTFAGNSDKVTAWLNLAAFAILVYFGAFTGVSLDFLDGYAKTLAEALIAAGYFFGQLQLQPSAHLALRGRFPIFGTRYTK